MSEPISELARRLARRPRRCAAIISPTAAAKAAIGWSAMSATRLAASLFVRLKGAEAAKARPANGPTPPPGSMAICSTSSARAAASHDFRDVADEARRFLSMPTPEPTANARRDHRSAARRFVGISPAPVRHVAADFGHTRRNVSATSAALRLCTEPAASAFIRAATIALTSTRRPRPGRR